MQKKKVSNYKNMYGRKVPWEVCCTHCGEPIQDPKMANYELQSDRNTGALTGIYAVHKLCDMAFREGRKESYFRWNEFWLLTNPVTYMKVVFGLFEEMADAKAAPTKEAVSQINELLRLMAPYALRDITEEEKKEAQDFIDFEQRTRMW